MNRKERPYATEHEHEQVPPSDSESMMKMESILEPISPYIGMMDIIPEKSFEENERRGLDGPGLLPPLDANDASRWGGSSASASASAATEADPPSSYIVINNSDSSRSNTVDTDSDFTTEMISTYRGFINSQYFSSPLLSSEDQASSEYDNDSSISDEESSEQSEIIDNTLSQRTNTLLDDFQCYLSQIDSPKPKSKSPSSFFGPKDKHEHPPEGNRQNNDLPYERQLFDANISSNSKEDPPDLESYRLDNDRQYFTGDPIDGIASNNRCVNAIFNGLRSSNLIGGHSGLSQRISRRKRRSSSSTTNERLWHDEVNYFQQATQGRNEYNLRNPEAGSDTDTIEGRYRNSRAAMITSCRPPMCNTIAKHTMLICAVIGSLVVILLGANIMETKKDDLLPKQLAIFKRRHKGSFAIHKPNWFDRSTNWKGQTYHEAIEFCESNNQVLCHAELMCPYGPGSVPILPNYDKDAFHEEELNSNNPGGLAWVPIGDTTNAWIQLGSRDFCLRYDFIHNGQSPAWGITGEDNEEITRHIVCCPPIGKQQQQQHEQFSSASPPVIPIYFEHFEHTWYDNSEGWDGSTIGDARDFCSSKESRYPCPYESYCPEGPHHPPVEGGPNKGVVAVGSTTTNDTSLFKTTKSKSWAPIIDEFGSGIVQIGFGGYLKDGEEVDEEEEGSKKNDMCKVHRLSSGDDLSGMGFEESTHVMCCK